MSKYSEAIDFEQIIAKLYQAILRSEGFGTVKAEHNITIKGRSGATSQFDIYWEYQVAGVLNKVAIECKNYAHTVSVDDVRDFAYKLHDVGNVRGIMVTRVGYQDGAKKIAKNEGIYLKKFQFPDELDWTGRIRTIILSMHVLTLDNVQHEFIFDEDWVKEHFPGQKSFTSKRPVSTEEISFFKENGENLGTLHEMDNKLPRGEHGTTGLTYYHSFSEPTFIRAPELPGLKINGIKYRYDVVESSEEHSISVDDVLLGILTNDIGEKEYSFFFDNTVANFVKEVPSGDKGD